MRWEPGKYSIGTSLYVFLVLILDKCKMMSYCQHMGHKSKSVKNEVAISSIFMQRETVKREKLFTNLF